MGISHGLSRPSALRSGCRILALLLVLWFLSACAPANQKEDKLHKEIQALKAQITAMQAKLDRLEAGQKNIVELLKQPPPVPAPVAVPSLPPAPKPLTVGQLLAGKERYLGSRVTVRGLMGPVMVHHKSFMLKSPQGMVEVLLGILSDPRLVQILTSTPLENKPITVIGEVNLPPARSGGAQIQVNAEAVEF